MVSKFERPWPSERQTALRIRYSWCRDPIVASIAVWRQVRSAYLNNVRPIPIGRVVAVGAIALGPPAVAFVWAVGLPPVLIARVVGRRPWELDERSLNTGKLLDRLEAPSYKAVKALKADLTKLDCGIASYKERRPSR